MNEYTTSAQFNMTVIQHMYNKKQKMSKCIMSKPKVK